eukprot:CAMPEP_0185822210 /NCGR_PEP_ID=MMETSP1322-20130828/26406_1 /TAXON_ID=265543 /ORGANISM="Minutocellus polymorphus, Strain RCC2270" /LENGTH=55 /DNA_ID=CAMNT_0028519641 /DNA_START=119 /DNA_END=283 /DNA_ORIENTATION=-
MSSPTALLPPPLRQSQHGVHDAEMGADRMPPAQGRVRVFSAQAQDAPSGAAPSPG